MIRTADNHTVTVGDHAFNYYDRKSGTVADRVDSEGWFTFRHDDGSTTTLNGERICSDEYAKAKGWMS